MKKIQAVDATVGQTICFREERLNVVIESVETTRTGKVGIHANDETWYQAYEPDDVIWVREEP